MTDPLENLLQQTDEACAIVGEAASCPADLTAIVHRRALHRRRIRRNIAVGVGSLSLIAVVSVFYTVSFNNHSSPPQSKSVDVAQLLAEQQQLRVAIEQQQKRIELLERIIERKRELQAVRIELALHDPADDVRQEIERTALIIVHQADRKHQRLGLTESAVRDYQSVVESFPHTEWADVARMRLAALEKGNN